MNDLAPIRSFGSALDAVVHDVENAVVTRHPFLAGALRHAWIEQVTGYVVTPENEVIKLKAGKRPALKRNSRRWVRADIGVS